MCLWLMQPSNRYCFFLFFPNIFSKDWNKFRFRHPWFILVLFMPLGKALPWSSADNKNTLLLSGVYRCIGSAHTGRTQHEGFVVEHRVFNLCFISGWWPTTLPSTPSWAPFTSVVLIRLTLMAFIYLLILFSYEKQKSSTSDTVNMCIYIYVYIY